MKKIFTILFLVGMLGTAQTERYFTRTGSVQFEGSVASFEPIEAIHKSVTIVIDAQTGDLASLALMKGFEFPIALMQEHFNENYVESDQYPKTTLKGRLNDFSFATLGDHIDHTFTFTGDLELHGVKRGITFPVTIKESNGSLLLQSEFSVRPEDYLIEIPSVVSNKIADLIEIKVSGTLLKR